MSQPNFTPAELDNAIRQGLVTKRKHPEFNLWILNYTQECTNRRAWNNVTEQCRGLIIDDNFEIVSRPFKKFFTVHEWVEVFERRIPNEDFTVYDKLDGSLGITYHYAGKTFISTRGSFESPQAIRGTQLFRAQFCCAPLDPSVTYLFEIICNESRYVVDYGEWEGLVLLAAIDTDKGAELDISSREFSNFERADILSCGSFGALHGLVNIRPNSEGVVVQFESGLRLKVKADKYLELFRVVCSLSEKSIWEALKSGNTINEIKSTVPDHYKEFVDRVSTEIWEKYNFIESTCQRDFQSYTDPIIKGDRDAKRNFALWAQTKKFPSILYALYDANYKKVAQVIWEIVKPNVSNHPASWE